MGYRVVESSTGRDSGEQDKSQALSNKQQVSTGQEMPFGQSRNICPFSQLL